MSSQRKYRISFFEPHLHLYGGIRRVVELSNNLVDLGHEVTIYHSDGSDCEWMEVKATIKSYDDILRQDHEIIIFNDPNPVDLKFTYQSHAEVKVFYVLGLYEKELLPGFKVQLHRRKYRRTLLTKTCLESPFFKLANASWLVEWLKSYMKIEARPLIGGINRSVFHPVAVSKDTNEVRVLCTGDPRPGKGTSNVIEAMEIAKRGDSRLNLYTYYGKGIPQAEMATCYSSADIFVDAQHQAGWNNPVAEAMACKVPVVCTNIGGVRDFAFHEDTALVVPRNDPVRLAEAIIRLTTDIELRDVLRENAYQYIAKYDWQSTAIEFVKIIDDVYETADGNPSKSYGNPAISRARLLLGLTRYIDHVASSLGGLRKHVYS